MRSIIIVLIILLGITYTYSQDIDYSIINAKCNVIDSLKQGDCINTDSTGRIVSIIKYVDDVKDGYSFYFYSTGTISEIKLWTNGILRKSIRYYHNGIKEWDINMGEKGYEGDSYEYYDNGKLKVGATYKTNLPFIDIGNVHGSVIGWDTASAVYVGKYEEFYKNGVLKVIGNYREDSCYREVNAKNTDEDYIVSYIFFPIKIGGIGNKI